MAETPLEMVEEVRYYAKRALALINIAKDKIVCNTDEYAYWQTDIEAIDLMAESYGKKIEAAIKIITYKIRMAKIYMVFDTFRRCTSFDERKS